VRGATKDNELFARLPYINYLVSAEVLTAFFFFLIFSYFFRDSRDELSSVLLHELDAVERFVSV
jgi:hypothetical protein